MTPATTFEAISLVPVIAVPDNRGMATTRFIMIAGRTTKQGQQVNIGKDEPAYEAMTTTLTLNAEDMAELGLAEGAKALVRSEDGEAVFTCQSGKMPRGMVFVPYGPPTCRLMGNTTDGTGMPTSKGWEVEILPLSTLPETAP